MPAIIAKLVIRMGRSLLVAPSRAAAGASRPATRLGKGNQKERVRHGDPDRHDGSHEGLNIERRVGEPQHPGDARNDRGYRQDNGDGQPQRLKIGGQQQENDPDCDQQARAEAVE
jgi:hypothetical protein